MGRSDRPDDALRAGRPDAIEPLDRPPPHLPPSRHARARGLARGPGGGTAGARRGARPARPFELPSAPGLLLRRHQAFRRSRQTRRRPPLRARPQGSQAPLRASQGEPAGRPHTRLAGDRRHISRSLRRRHAPQPFRRRRLLVHGRLGALLRRRQRAAAGERGRGADVQGRGGKRSRRVLPVRRRRRMRDRIQLPGPARKRRIRSDLRAGLPRRTGAGTGRLSARRNAAGCAHLDSTATASGS
jgi:hypothetical protein